MSAEHLLAAFNAMEQPWMRQAACKGVVDGSTDETGRVRNPFFPARGASQREGKEYCARCPVKQQCKAYAEETNSKYGIWGGVMQTREPEYATYSEEPHDTEVPVSIQSLRLYVPGEMESGDVRQDSTG